VEYPPFAKLRNAFAGRETWCSTQTPSSWVFLQTNNACHHSRVIPPAESRHSTNPPLVRKRGRRQMENLDMPLFCGLRDAREHRPVSEPVPKRRVKSILFIKSSCFCIPDFNPDEQSSDSSPLVRSLCRYRCLAIAEPASHVGGPTCC